MAAPLLKVVRACPRWNSRHLRGFYRTLLSDEYRCDSEWKFRLESKFLQKMDPRQFGYDLLKRFEKEKYISPMDFELFANKIQELEHGDDPMIEDIIHKFRHVDDSIPVNPAAHHALARAYIEADRVDRLLMMMKDKHKYGIFPDFQSFCLLLDHLIEHKDFEGAADVAHEVMLQEDLSHQLCNLLCVYALAKCYRHQLYGKPHAPKEGEGETTEQMPKKDEEETFVRVKVIQNPYYDDHFDIKDEKLLLGKSLYQFGKHTMDLKPVDARSLQLIGLGLYEKFDLGLRVLEHWMDECTDPEIIHEEARQSFHDSLHGAAIRDENAEPVPMGRKTLDDSLEEMRITESEKADLIQQNQVFYDKLTSRGLHQGDLEQSVERTVKMNIIEYEGADMKTMKDNYLEWIMNRQKLMPEYVLEHQKKDKLLEIREKLLVIQEKEELLSYFANRKIIAPYLGRARKYKKKEEQGDPERDQYVEAPGERNVKKTIKR